MFRTSEYSSTKNNEGSINMANVIFERDGTDNCRIICNFIKAYMSDDLKDRIIAKLKKVFSELKLLMRWRPGKYVLIVEVPRAHLHGGIQYEIEQVVKAVY